MLYDVTLPATSLQSAWVKVSPSRFMSAIATHHPTIGIAAIFKNEAPYILEWIAHHQLLGIDRFFIADNESTDGTAEILKALERAGIVTVINWKSPAGVKPQLPAYRHLLSKHAASVDWLMFIDADEFLTPTSELDFREFLKTFQDDVGAIAINWCTYGSSHTYKYEPAPVTSRFTWHSHTHNPVNHGFKSVCRPEAILDFTCPHNVELKPGYRYLHTNRSEKLSLNLTNENPNLRHCQSIEIHWDFFRINHYIIKSWEEYANKKSTRGRAFSDFPLQELYFWGHDFHDVQSNLHPEKLNRLRDKIHWIGTHISKDLISISQDAFQAGRLPSPPMLGNLDNITFDGSTLQVDGWALEWTSRSITKMELLLDHTTRIEFENFHRTARQDVLNHHPNADLHCGFSIRIQTSILPKSVMVRGIFEESYASMPLEWRLTA